MTATIHRGLTYEQYDALPGWRWSHIKAIADSPLHVRHAMTAEDTDTPSRGLLRAIHCLVLEPQNFGREFSVFAGRRDARTSAYQSHLAAYPDTTVLNEAEGSKAIETAAAIKRHPVVQQLLAEGEGEVTITWTDPATGLLCKARIDWLNPALFFDLKTIGTVHEVIVAKRVVQNQYHGQLAHYDAGLAAVGMANRRAIVVSAEGKGAQDVAAYELDRGAPDGPLFRGHQLRADFMARLAACVATDTWPGRHPDLQALHLPNYALLDPDELDDADDTNTPDLEAP